MSHFTIGIDGHVTSATATSAAPDMKPVIACITDLIHSIEFPKPHDAPVDVEYQLTFDVDN